MKKLSLLVFFGSFLGSTFGQNYSDSITVNLFLLDECRISQSISGEIRYVDKTYNQGPFYFKAFFPSETSTEEKINQFMRSYSLDIPYETDYTRAKTNFYGATVAPEVVVYDEKNEKLLYRGRIDNSFADVGIRRRVITSRDLRNVLDAIIAGQEIEIVETKAIGCYLNH
jgi:hypothetical protein